MNSFYACVSKPSITNDVILPHEENHGIRCLKQLFILNTRKPCNAGHSNTRCLSSPKTPCWHNGHNLFNLGT